MRKSEFRGKRIDNGDWAYGSLVYTPLEFLIDKEYSCVIIPHENNGMSSNEEIDITFDNFYLVEPKTVGRFTELNDSKGQSIYEGDLLKSPNGGIYKVIWDETKFSTEWTCNQTKCLLIKGFADITEVIGNIYEHEHLLK